jgi:hypothetical protein
MWQAGKRRREWRTDLDSPTAEPAEAVSWGPFRRLEAESQRNPLGTAIDNGELCMPYSRVVLSATMQLSVVRSGATGRLMHGGVDLGDLPEAAGCRGETTGPMMQLRLSHLGQGRPARLEAAQTSDRNPRRRTVRIANAA